MIFNFGALFGGSQKLVSPKPEKKRADVLDLSLLDITYINDRIIAMGYPPEKTNSKDGSRNKIEDIQNFLKSYHPGKFLVWNINDGRADQSQHGKKLSDKLGGQVLNIPWDTWNGQESSTDCRSRCPTPPLAQLVRICYSIQGWLDLHDDNVAAIICRSEHRTPVLIACYLRFCNEAESALAAYNDIVQKRYKNANGKGSNDSSRRGSLSVLPGPPLPSLKMLFKNFDLYMDIGRPPNPTVLALLNLSMENLPVDQQPRVDIWNKSELVYSSTEVSEDEIMWNTGEGFFFHKINQRLCGDFVLVVRFGGAEPGMTSATGDEYDENHVLFRYTNCTGFIAPGAPIRLNRDSVDVTRLYADGFEDSFALTIVVDTLDGPVQGDQYYSDALEPLLKGPQATRQGLLDIASFHTRVANMKRLDRLLSMGFSSEAATLGLQLAGNNTDTAKKLIEEGLGTKLDVKSHFSPLGSEISESPSRSPIRGMRKGSSVSTIQYAEVEPLTTFASASARVLVTSRAESLAKINEGGSAWDKPVKCASCGKDDPEMAIQILECASCSQRYHTDCVGEPILPFKASSSVKEQIERDSFVRTHFSDWQCKKCVSRFNDELSLSESSPMPRWDEAKAVPSSAPTRNMFSTNLHSHSEEESPSTSSKGRESDGQFFPEQIQNERRPSSQLLQRQASLYSIEKLTDADSMQSSKKLTRCNSAVSGGEKSMVAASSPTKQGYRVDYIGCDIEVDAFVQVTTSSPRARSESTNDLKSLVLGKSAESGGVDDHSISEIAGQLRADGIEVELEALQEAFKHSRSRASLYGGRPSMLAMRPSMSLDIGAVGDNAAFPTIENLDSPAGSKEGSQSYNGISTPLSERCSSAASESATPQRPSMGDRPDGLSFQSALLKGINRIQELPLASSESVSPERKMAEKVVNTAENFVLAKRAPIPAAKSGDTRKDSVQARILHDSASSVGTAPVSGLPIETSNTKNSYASNGVSSNSIKKLAMANNAEMLSAQYPNSDDLPAKNKGLSDLFAARNPKPLEKKNHNLSEMLAARNADVLGENTSPKFDESKPMPMPIRRPNNNSALSGMMASRNPPSADKNSALSEMLAAKNMPPAPPVEKNMALSDMLNARNAPLAGKNGALSNMLAARNSPPEEKNNALASLLAARNPPPADKNEALAGMLAARNNQPEEKNSALSNLLAARNPLPAEKNAALSGLLASRNPPPADKNSALLSMLNARNPPQLTLSSSSSIPSNDDERYTKFFSMLKAGIPHAAVVRKIEAEGLDPTVLDREKSNTTATETAAPPVPPANSAASGVPLKDDPQYSKFFKMLKAGVPRGAVDNKMQSENLDPAVLDMDPNKPAPKVSSKDEDPGVPLKEDPRYAKFFKMLKAGVPRGAVENKISAEGLDPKVLDMDPEKPAPDATKSSPPGVPLQEDPRYAKFFKMLKAGVPRGAVENKISAEGLDPKALDMDPEKPYPDAAVPVAAVISKPSLTPIKDDERYTKYFDMLKSGISRSEVEKKILEANLDPEVFDMDPNKPPPDAYGWKYTAPKSTLPLQDDPRYGKFFKMLKAGVPRGAVENKILAENLDPKVLDMNPEKPMQDSNDQVQEGPAVPLKDDPKYGKYLKMIKAGVPRGAVEMKMTNENLDPKALDMDPEVPLNGSKEPAKESGPSVPLKDDLKYGKYFKMLKAGVPRGAVELKMTNEDLDPKALDMDPEKPYPLPGGAVEAVSLVPLKDDPKYGKFFKMLKAGVPRGAVELKVSAESLDPKVLDMDPEKPLTESENSAVPLQDDPRYAKFFKMLKAGVPRGAVEVKIKGENLDPNILDMDPEKPAPDAVKPVSSKPAVVPAKDDPRYAKFFKMIEEGTARGAVRQKIAVAGLVPAALDAPNAPAPVQEDPSKPKKLLKGAAKVVKPKEKRRKLHWVDIPKERVMKSEDSVWVGMDSIKIDVHELEDLFVEKLDEVKPAKAKEKEAEPAKPTKVSLLDAKRGMNTSIAIARVKMPYSEIRDAIMQLRDGSLTEEQLIQLLEYMPTEEEELKLKEYKDAGNDIEMLGEAEKFMLEMAAMPQRIARVEAMIFKEQFAGKIADLRGTSLLVEAACDDVKLSLRLKKLLSIILKLGNELNQRATTGFTLESLLKLNTAKAFDKKTSILHYLVMLADRNDRSLLEFKDDLKHVFPASRVVMTQLQSDFFELEKTYAVFRSVVQKDSNLRPANLLSPRGSNFPEDNFSPVKDLNSPHGSHDTAVSETRKSIKLEELSRHKTVTRQAEDANGRKIQHFDLAFEVTEESKERDRVRKALGEFMKKVDNEMDSVRKLIDGVEKKFFKVLDYFGEDPEMSPQKFFTTLHSFMLAFDEACIYVDRQKKIKERERKLAEKRQLEAEARLNKPKKRLEKVKESANSPGWKRKGRHSKAAPSRLSSTEDCDDPSVSAPAITEPPVVLPESVNAKVLEAMEKSPRTPPEPKSVSKIASKKSSTPPRIKILEEPKVAAKSPLKNTLGNSTKRGGLGKGESRWDSSRSEVAMRCLEGDDSGGDSADENNKVPSTPTEQEEMNEWKEESLPEVQLGYAAKDEVEMESKYAEEL